MNMLNLLLIAAIVDGCSNRPGFRAFVECLTKLKHAVSCNQSVAGLDQDHISALRESDKIAEFLEAMEQQGKLTAFERSLINEERGELDRQVGDFNELSEDVVGPVLRQSNYLLRLKIAQLHPEMAEELERFIAEKKHHPLPAVPDHLQKPGAALNEYKALLDWIMKGRNNGKISHEAAWAAYEPALELLEDEGIDAGELNLKTDKAVLHHAAQLIRQVLIEAHPELAEEIKNLSQGRSR